MLILLAHSVLEDAVQVSQGGVGLHKHQPPDLGADATEAELELIDLHGLSNALLLKHHIGSAA